MSKALPPFPLLTRLWKDLEGAGLPYLMVCSELVTFPVRLERSDGEVVFCTHHVLFPQMRQLLEIFLPSSCYSTLDFISLYFLMC